MVLEPLRKEALTKVGASGGIGAPCSGTVNGVNEAGGKRDMPADVEGCDLASGLSQKVNVDTRKMAEYALRM